MYPLFNMQYGENISNFYSTSNTAKLLLYINLAIFKNYGYKITNSIPCRFGKGGPYPNLHGIECIKHYNNF